MIEYCCKGLDLKYVAEVLFPSCTIEKDDFIVCQSIVDGQRNEIHTEKESIQPDVVKQKRQVCPRLIAKGSFYASPIERRASEIGSLRQRSCGRKFNESKHFQGCFLETFTSKRVKSYFLLWHLDMTFNILLTATLLYSIAISIWLFLRYS